MKKKSVMVFSGSTKPVIREDKNNGTYKGYHVYPTWLRALSYDREVSW